MAISLRRRIDDEVMFVAPGAEPFPGYNNVMVADIEVDDSSEMLVVHSEGVDVTCDDNILEFRTQNKAVLIAVLGEIKFYMEIEDMRKIGFVLRTFDGKVA